MKRTAFFFVLFSMILLMAACSSIDCPLNDLVLMRCGFFSHRGDSVSIADTITISIKPTTAELDPVVVNKLTQKHWFTLPLSYKEREDEYYLHIWGEDYDLYDTIRVTKESAPHFESPDCSPRFFHTITNVWVTHNAIDSIGLNQKTVDYDNTQTHLKIYLHSSY